MQIKVGAERKNEKVRETVEAIVKVCEQTRPKRRAEIATTLFVLTIYKSEAV